MVESLYRKPPRLEEPGLSIYLGSHLAGKLVQFPATAGFTGEAVMDELGRQFAIPSVLQGRRRRMRGGDHPDLISDAVDIVPKTMSS